MSHRALIYQIRLAWKGWIGNIRSESRSRPVCRVTHQLNNWGPVLRTNVVKALQPYCVSQDVSRLRRALGGATSHLHRVAIFCRKHAVEQTRPNSRPKRIPEIGFSTLQNSVEEFHSNRSGRQVLAVLWGDQDGRERWHSRVDQAVVYFGRRRGSQCLEDFFSNGGQHRVYSE